MGQVKKGTHVIEFQKKGLLHIHILLILDDHDKFQNAADVSTVVFAHILDQNKDLILHDMIIKHIIYGKCDINPNAVCLHLHTKIYTNKFPKSFQEKTEWLPDMGYPIYKKAEILGQEDDTYIDNRWVVFYNPYLLKKFNAHINVKICSCIKAITYLYKYVCKGHDLTDILVMPQFKENYDEITEFHILR